MHDSELFFTDNFHVLKNWIDTVVIKSLLYDINFKDIKIKKYSQSP